MLHQDYPQNYDLANKTQDNLRIPSISGTQNVGDELYGKRHIINGEADIIGEDNIPIIIYTLYCVEFFVNAKNI